MLKANGGCATSASEIPRGSKDRYATLRSKMAEILRSRDDLKAAATLTKNPDGAVSMDICLTCSMKMGNMASIGVNVSTNPRPNMRVQRTRSSASPPHSPLTRHPLGGLEPWEAKSANSDDHQPRET